MPADPWESEAKQHDSSTKPKTLGVIFVHGIGSQRRGDTLVQIGKALHEWLTNWLKDWNVEILDARLNSDAADAEAPPHARIIFRDGDNMSSPYSWAIAESYWADCFPQPSYRQFVRWTLTVIPVAVLQHLTAQFRPELDIRKATRSLNQSGFMSIGTFFRLVPHEVPRLRKELLDDPGERFSGLWLRALSRSYSSWFILPALLVGGLALQLLLILLLIPAALPFSSIRSFARWIQMTLSATIGDSYLFVTSPIAESAIVSKVQRDIEWLARRCDQTVVVAHSQGAAVAYGAIEQWSWRNRVPDQLKLLITYGSGIRKLFELRTALRRTAWSRRKLATFFAFVAMAASALMAGLVVMLFVGTISFLTALTTMIVLYIVVGGVLSAAAQEFDARPSLLKVLWDDLYASHDPVPNGAIVLKESDDSNVRQSIQHLTGSDPLMDFYLRQRDVANRRSAISDHTTYWEGLDDFVARVVTRLFAVSEIPLHSLTPKWLDVASDRRKWRVQLLSACRATAAIAALAVFLWISQTRGFLENIGFRTLDAAKSTPDWAGSYEQLRRVASAVPPEWIGATALGLTIALAVGVLYAIARLGWNLWEQREHQQFFYMMGYETGLFGPAILGASWLSLAAFPLAASALLASGEVIPSTSAWWIVGFLSGLTVVLLWRAGGPPGRAYTWVSARLREGESMLLNAAGDVERLKEARFRLKMAAIVPGAKGSGGTLTGDSRTGYVSREHELLDVSE
jgi:hypothetical protein